MNKEDEYRQNADNSESQRDWEYWKGKEREARWFEQERAIEAARERDEQARYRLTGNQTSSEEGTGCLGAFLAGLLNPELYNDLPQERVRLIHILVFVAEYFIITQTRLIAYAVPIVGVTFVVFSRRVRRFIFTSAVAVGILVGGVALLFFGLGSLGLNLQHAHALPTTLIDSQLSACLAGKNGKTESGRTACYETAVDQWYERMHHDDKLIQKMFKASRYQLNSLKIADESWRKYYTNRIAMMSHSQNKKVAIVKEKCDLIRRRVGDLEYGYSLKH